METIEVNHLAITNNVNGRVIHYALYPSTFLGNRIIGHLRENLPYVTGGRFDMIPEGVLYQCVPDKFTHERDEETLHLYIKPTQEARH